MTKRKRRVLERIRLTNFQRHGQLKVKPGEHITAVIGDSDKGKSSLCRAIRWLALNKPRGSGFIRWGQKSCSVKIRLDGHDIERIKDSKGNRYILDGSEFKAVGNDVPADIGALLAMGPENFQSQHDPPFWFGLTPGELGKELNKIVDMEVIDRSIAEVSKRLRRGRSTEDVCEQRLAQAEDKAKELEWVPRYVEEFEAVVELERTAQQTKDDVEDLKEALAELAGCRETIETARDYVKAGEIVLDLGAAYKTAKRGWEQLSRLMEEIAKHQGTIEGLGYNRDEAKQRLEKESEGRCPICGTKMKPKGE